MTFMMFGLQMAATAVAASLVCSHAYAAPVTVDNSKKPVAIDQSPQEINGRFEAALSEIGTGRFQHAILQLRAILAEDPSLVRVRLELARALFLARDFREARQQFLIALSAHDVPDPVRRNIMNFIRAIDTSRGFSSSLMVAMTRPQGAARKYETSVVNLDVFGTGRTLPFTLVRPHVPAFAVELDGEMRQLWSTGKFSSNGQSALFVRGHVHFLDGPNLSGDDDRIDFAPGIQLSWPRSALAVEARESAFITGGAYLENRTGIGVHYSRENRHGISLAVDVSAAHATNHQSSSISGTQIESFITIQQGTGGNGYWMARLSLEHRDANRTDYSYNQFNLMLARQIDLIGGISVNASVYGTYFLQGATTPGFTELRRDHEYGFDISIEKTDLLILDRYAPFFSVGLSRHISSIAAYSYSEARAQIGVRSLF